MDISSLGIDVEAARAAIRAKMIEDQRKRLRWGSAGPPMTGLVGGARVVAAHKKIFRIHPEATYHDFLAKYVPHVFGEEWWAAERGKSTDEMHPVMQWYDATAKFIIAHGHDRPNFNQAIMPAEAGHFFRLAFNLHQIEHQGLLLASMVKRLKYSREFQGARYEVAVSAAFARANFRIDLEPEGKVRASGASS